METCANYTSEKMYFSSDEKKYVNKILQLKQEHPDDVQIIKMPEENQGCIYAIIPSKWLKIVPPRKMELSPEQKAAAAERMRIARMNMMANKNQDGE